MDLFNTGINRSETEIKVGDIITDGNAMAKFAKVLNIDTQGNIEVEYMSTNTTDSTIGIWQGDYYINEKYESSN